MNSIPNELLSKIFEHSTPEDLLLSFRLTSSDWRATATSSLCRHRDIGLVISSFQKLSRQASSIRHFNNRQQWLFDLMRYLLSVFGDRITRIQFDHVPHPGAFMLMTGANTGESSPWVLTRQLLQEIQKEAPKMVELHFGLAKVEPTAYQVLCEFGSLRSLAIHDIEGSFEDILNNLPGLRRLTISGKDVSLNWPGNANIRQLCIRHPMPRSYTDMCGDECEFQSFIVAFPNLRVHLDARTGLSIISPIMRTGISSWYRQLTSLKISTVVNYFCTFRTWTREEVEPFANIRSLTLKLTRINEVLLQNLRFFPHLSNLRIWFRRPCSQTELTAIASIPTLRSLQMRDFVYPGDGAVEANDSSQDGPRYCQRLKALRVWATSENDLIRAKGIIFGLIKRSAQHLRILQFIPGRRSPRSTLSDFAAEFSRVLVQTGVNQGLEWLEMPVLKWPSLIMPTADGFSDHFLDDPSLQQFFAQGAKRIRKLALDIDAESLEWIQKVRDRSWAELFPHLTDLTFRLYGDQPKDEAGNDDGLLEIDRFLEECPFVKHLYIDAACIMSKPLIDVVGCHSRLQQLTVVRAVWSLEEDDIDFEGFMRLLISARATTIRRGRRLPALHVNMTNYICSDEVKELLFSVGVILK